MVIAANSAEGTEAIEPSPSSTSLHGLDAVNLFLAGALSGFGPYVAVFLAEQDWTQRNIGFVLTAAGFAGLLSQIPGGELLDVIRSKRFAVALGASMVAAGTRSLHFGRVSRAATGAAMAAGSVFASRLRDCYRLFYLPGGRLTKVVCIYS